MAEQSAAPDPTEVSETSQRENTQDIPRAGGLLLASAADQRAAHDQLGFTPYVNALAQFLLSQNTVGPLTISIEGEWGSGKSSFLEQFRNKLKEGPAGKPVTVWFNAWRHNKAEELWAAFAVEFMKQVAEAEKHWLRALLEVDLPDVGAVQLEGRLARRSSLRDDFHRHRRRRHLGVREDSATAPAVGAFDRRIGRSRRGSSYCQKTQ